MSYSIINLIILFCTLLVITTMANADVKNLNLQIKISKNLSSLYEKKYDVFNNIKTKQRNYLDNSFSTSMNNLLININTSAIDESTFENCLEVSKNIAYKTIFAGTNKLNDCYDNYATKFYDYIQSLIMSKNLIDAIPYCYNQDYIPIETINCLDRQIKTRTNEFKEFYTNLTSLFINKQEYLANEMRACIDNYNFVIEKSIIIAQDQMVTCVHDKSIDKKTNIALNNTIANHNLSNLYNEQKKYLETKKIDGWYLIKRTEFMFTPNNITAENKKNNDYCSNYNIKTDELIINKFTKQNDDCFNNQLSTFKNFALSIVQNNDFKNSFSDCYKNEIPISVLKCIDHAVLNKSAIIKNYYKIAENKFSINMNSIILLASNCSSISKVYFDNFINNQKTQLEYYNKKCQSK